MLHVFIFMTVYDRSCIIMSSFRIASVISLVLVSCILQSCSTPIVTITRNDDTQIVLLADGSSSDDQPKETFSQLISSILSPVFNRLLLLFLRELMSLMIGMEILTISTGNHFGMIVPQLSMEADLELHQSAMAVMELWLQLPTVENIESALQKATSDVGELVGHSILKDVPVDPNINQKIIQLVLEKIELRLKDDSVAYKKFTEAKARIKAEFVKLHDDHRTYFSSGEKMTLKTEREVYKQWFSHKKVKTFLVNKLFAENGLKRVPHTSSPDYDYVLLAKALIRLARVSERTVEVNHIYQGVVSELAGEFDYENFKLRTSSSSLGGFSSGAFANKTIPILFKKLNDKFSENATLYAELVTQKNHVINDAFIEDFPFPQTGFW